MFQLLLLGVGAGCAIGGLYILILAFFKPGTFLKPDLAKWQGVIAFIVGVLLLLWFFSPGQ